MKQLFKYIAVVLIAILIVGCSLTHETPKPKATDTITKEIKGVDENLNYELPLGIDSIKLMTSGKAILVMSEDNITSEELTVCLDVKDIYLLPFGNGGYRSIIFLKNDGTVSAVNSSELIENKKIEVINNLGGFVEVASVKQGIDPSGSLIYVVLENGEEQLLDEYIK